MQNRWKRLTHPLAGSLAHQLARSLMPSWLRNVGPGYLRMRREPIARGEVAVARPGLPYRTQRGRRPAQLGQRNPEVDQ